MFEYKPMWSLLEIWIIFKELRGIKEQLCMIKAHDRKCFYKVIKVLTHGCILAMKVLYY